MYTMSDLDAAQRCYKPNPVPRICIGANAIACSRPAVSPAAFATLCPVPAALRLLIVRAL
jgi:hypothetical protein